MANGWLQSEGKARVLTSLQYPQRQWLKQLLLIKRSAAFRQMCASPVELTIKSERARKSLRRLAAARRTCSWLSSRNVQVRRYQEGTCTMYVLDGKQDAPLAKLTSDDERRSNLASEISTYLGETVRAIISIFRAAAPVVHARVVRQIGTLRRRLAEPRARSLRSGYLSNSGVALAGTPAVSLHNGREAKAHGRGARRARAGQSTAGRHAAQARREAGATVFGGHRVCLRDPLGAKRAAREGGERAWGTGRRDAAWRAARAAVDVTRVGDPGRVPRRRKGQHPQARGRGSPPPAVLLPPLWLRTPHICFPVAAGSELFVRLQSSRKPPSACPATVCPSRHSLTTNLPTETRVDSPTLVEIRDEAIVEKRRILESLEGLLVKKVGEKVRAASRRWPEYRLTVGRLASAQY